MNEQIKQRLVGAVVLVSLAAIFIPMLLDGGNSSTMPRFGSNIPDQPDFDFEPLEIPLQAPAPVATEQPTVIEQAEQSATSHVTPQVTTSSPQPKAQPKPPLVQKPSESALNKQSAEDEPVRWVVQLGSFSQSDNALSLRDKLRKSGFTAFVEKYRDSNKTSYRVRVGPELKRETAEKQRDELERKLKLKGIIMGYP